MTGSQQEDPWRRYALALEKWKTDSENARAGFEAVNTYAASALKAALLVNGGAAVAALAFAGHLFSAEHAPTGLAAKVVPAILLFAMGTLLAAIATAPTYLAQLFFATVDRKTWHRVLAEIFRVAAILLVGAAYVEFYCGIRVAVTALSVAPQ